MEINTFIFPTIASALLLGFYDVAKKRAVLDNPVAPTLFFSNLCGSVFFVAALLYHSRNPARKCPNVTVCGKFGLFCERINRK